jgi:acetylornithine deacetylase
LEERKVATDVVQTLRDLVRIPSVNPMGREMDGDIYYEHRVTDYLEKHMHRLGLPCERHTVAPGRDNLIARIDGGDSILMLQAHQDTVPVDGMTIDPWSARLINGRLFGRGACDIKGGMACILTVASRLAEQRPAGMPTVVLAFTVNEEYGFTGAAQLRELCTSGHSSLLPRHPDAILVAEPTDLNVVVAHKGVLRWRCHTRGRAAHSSDPAAGVNAIYAMGRVLAAIEHYQQHVLSAVETHSLVGGPTISVGLIEGGVSVNTVPDHCCIELERRLLPDDDPEAEFQKTIQYISQQCGAEVSIEHEAPFMASGGLSDAGNAALADRLAAVVRQSGVACEKIGVPYGTDACQLSADGAPTVVFGPGSIEQAHTADEWIAVDQLEMATEIIDRFVRQLEGRKSCFGRFRS